MNRRTGRFHLAVWQLRACVFLLYGSLLALTPPSAFVGGDIVVWCGCAVWGLVTHTFRPTPLVEATFVSLCTWMGVSDAPIALAAAFTFLLCHVGLHGGHGFPSSVMVSTTLLTVSAHTASTSPLTAYGSALLLGVAVWGVARMAFARQSSLRRRLQSVRHRVERLSRYVPVRYLASRLDDPVAPCALERIWLVAVFVDLEGFTAAVARSPLQTIEALVQSFVVQTTQVARSHGGVVMKLLGDGALVVFPQADGRSHNEAATAAVRFARQMSSRRFGVHRTVSIHDQRLGVRVGVAAGECLLGDWGETDVLDYTVIGPPINLASRLQSAAQVGGVLMCASTARLVGTADSQSEPVSLWLPGLGAVTAVRVAGRDHVC